MEEAWNISYWLHKQQQEYAAQLNKLFQVCNFPFIYLYILSGSIKLPKFHRKRERHRDRREREVHTKNGALHLFISLWRFSTRAEYIIRTRDVLH